jgi:DNA repair exonuclease SbcCD ATPase subunit
MADRVGRVFRAAELFCSRVTEVEPGIIVGDFYDPAGAGRLYADCRDFEICDMESFSEYQDRLLSRDYYNAPASLRWNLYLAIVCSQAVYSRLVSSGFYIDLEEDEHYARKFVLPEDAVDEELPSRFIGVRAQTTASPPDPVGRWVQRLADAGLDGVAVTGASMDRVVAKFIEGDPIRLSQEKAAERTDSRLPPKDLWVTSLQTRKYRPCFDHAVAAFGDVNLVSGRNAVGKTSLLEAIELWFCGQTLRNPGEREPGAEVGLMFRTGSRYVWNKGVAPAEYRRRALTWYGIHKARDSGLHESFGRFNFFDSDAASRMSKSTTKKEMLAAFDGLILGRDAAVVLERARGVRERLAEQARATRRSRDDLANELRRIDATTEVTEKELDQLTTDWHAMFSGALGAAGIRAGQKAQVVSIQEVIGAVSALKTACETAVEHAGARSRATLGQIRAAHADLVHTTAEAEQRNADWTQIMLRLSRAEVDMAVIADRVAHLEELRKFVVNENAYRLLGLRAEIEALATRADAARDALDNVDAVTVGAFTGEERGFAPVIRECRDRLSRTRTKARANKQKFDEYARERDESSRLQEAVRSAALQLLKREPALDICPVCGTRHTPDDLRARVAESERAAGRQSRSGPEVQLQEADAEARFLEKRLHELEQLRLAAQVLLGVREAGSSSITAFIGALPTLRARATRDATELRERRALRSHLQAAGLTEERYEDLLAWAREEASELPVQYEERREFEAHMQAVLDAQARARVEHAEANSELMNARRAISALAVSRGVSSNQTPESLLVLLDKEAEVCVLAEAAFDAAEGLVELPPSATLADLLRIALVARDATGEIQARRDNSAASSKVLSRLRTQRKNCSAKHDIAREATQRIESAVAVLDSLLEADTSGRDAVQEFLAGCLDNLNELFDMLCWPREFESVRLTNQGLVAVRRATREEAPITKLSSGQRSALALATFLALNGCAHQGPPLMLLDDPVVFIDDLNALSFFDALRAIARRRERQIFYATANAKLASLFSRKFAYMGDAFRHLRLPRTP